MKKTNRSLLSFLMGICVTLVIILATQQFAPHAFAQALPNKKSYHDIRKKMQTIEKSFFLLLENYVDEVDSDMLFDGAMKGLFESIGDPYTTYLDPDEIKALENTTQGDFGGIGLYISASKSTNEDEKLKKDYVEVIAPIEGTPAYRAGVHPGDYIFEINEESAQSLSINEVSNLLKGPPGTSVDVTFLRGDDIKLNVTIERAQIEIPTIRSSLLDDGTTAYIRVIQFTPYTATRFKEALLDFSQKGMQRLIIDVRGNPGGLLESVLEILDFFIEKDKLLVSTKARQSYADGTFLSKNAPLLTAIPPIAVLINKGSASASEILTGVLADYELAETWGETSYGKGVVQQVIPIDNSLVKLTTARYYLPKGETIDKQGIVPQHVIEIPEITEDDINDYKIIIEENLIGNFVNANPAPAPEQIETFISSLYERDIQLEERSLKIFIRNEVNRRLSNPPIYDLEYDEVLRKAYEDLAF